MEVSWNRGSLKSSHSNRIFHDKNHLFLETPIDGNPHMSSVQNPCWLTIIGVILPNILPSPGWLYIYMHVYMYIYIYKCVYIYIYINAYVYIYIIRYIYICIYQCIHIKYAIHKSFDVTVHSSIPRCRCPLQHHRRREGASLVPTNSCSSGNWRDSLGSTFW